MTIRDSFCPKCGKPAAPGKLCRECTIGSTPWFSCEGRVKHVQCPACGATRQGSTWTDTTRTREELGPELARSAVRFHPAVRNPAIDVTMQDLTVNRSRASLALRGTFYNEPVEGFCTVEIAWQKEQCDRCNRISGSYYEGVVQVRADGRIPGSFETKTAAMIAQQIEDNLQAGGERLSFISDMGETKDGLDITVGSQHIGMQIAQAIVAQLGGRYTTHPKLVGEKNGRQLYRITYSVRLPRYQRHDVVRSGGRYYEVERVEARHIRVTDLRDGAGRSLRDESIERIVGNARAAETALVAFAESAGIGILDPLSGRTIETTMPGGMEIRAGEHVRILRDGDTVVIVR